MAGLLTNGTRNFPFGFLCNKVAREVCQQCFDRQTLSASERDVFTFCCLPTVSDFLFRFSILVVSKWILSLILFTRKGQPSVNMATSASASLLFRKQFRNRRVLRNRCYLVSHTVGRGRSKPSFQVGHDEPLSYNIFRPSLAIRQLRNMSH